MGWLEGLIDTVRDAVNPAPSPPTNLNWPDNGSSDYFDSGGVNGSSTSTPQVPSTWMANSDKGVDPGFRAPLPTSPNDAPLGQGYYTQDDLNILRNKYDSYWTPTPPAPPDPDFTFWDNLNQNIWDGTLAGQQGYQLNPPQQYPLTPQQAPEPYESSWPWLMREVVWDLPPQLPDLPYGTSW